MKARTITRTSVTLTLFALGVASVPALRSQAPASGPSVELVTPQLQQFTVGQLTGKPIRGANQEQLATLSEFLIDPRTGHVHFAVANSGDKTFRLVPMSALQPGSGPAGLQIGLNRQQWDQVPTMSEQELLGSVTIDATRQQQFQQQFQLSTPEPAAQTLIRATLMNEREVRVGNDRVGKVDDMVIDFNNRISAPAVKMNSGYGPDGQDVLIHFSSLQVNPEAHTPITAMVSVNDLRSPGSAPLAPTGYPSTLNPAVQPQQATAAASAVQQALDRDTSMPAGSVQAIPETHIVLRGTVNSDQKRMDVERAAQQAAPGVQIINQLMVRR